MATLKQYLTAVKMSQREFAARVGVREATVSAWTNGGTPRPDQMLLIAEATHGMVPVTVWFEGKSPKRKRVA